MTRSISDLSRQEREVLARVLVAKGKVRREEIDLAQGPYGLPIGVAGTQPIPASGVNVVAKGEGGGPVPSKPSNAYEVTETTPDQPGVNVLPNQDTARYVQRGSNTSAPLAANPTPPTTTKSVSDVTSGANAGSERKVMNPDGQMVDVSQMSDQDLEAARQMHAGLGNSREVQVIEQEIKNRGPRGYA